jgi:hypothetical protein
MKDNLKNGCPFCMCFDPKEDALSWFAGKRTFFAGKRRKLAGKYPILAGKVVNSAGKREKASGIAFK